MTNRKKKKLKKRNGIWHYSEYKYKMRIYDKICERIDMASSEKSVKAIFKDFAYTDIFRSDSRIIFRRGYRFVDSITFLQAVIDFWINTDFDTIQRTLNNVPDDLFEDSKQSFSVEVV